MSTRVRFLLYLYVACLCAPISLLYFLDDILPNPAREFLTQGSTTALLIQFLGLPVLAAILGLGGIVAWLGICRFIATRAEAQTVMRIGVFGKETTGGLDKWLLDRTFGK